MTAILAIAYTLCATAVLAVAICISYKLGRADERFETQARSTQDAARVPLVRLHVLQGGRGRTA